MDAYQEHLRDSQPDNSRWDGFDRGDTNDVIDQGSRVIGRMTSEAGHKVEVIEWWGDSDRSYEVYVNNRRVLFTEDRAKALVVGRWWLAGCPA